MTQQTTSMHILQGLLHCLLNAMICGMGISLILMMTIFCLNKIAQ